MLEPPRLQYGPVDPVTALNPATQIDPRKSGAAGQWNLQGNFQFFFGAHLTSYAVTSFVDAGQLQGRLEVCVNFETTVHPHSIDTCCRDTCHRGTRGSRTNTTTSFQESTGQSSRLHSFQRQFHRRTQVSAVRLKIGTLFAFIISKTIVGRIEPPHQRMYVSTALMHACHPWLCLPLIIRGHTVRYRP